jgi:hypothetical protein
MRLPVPCYIDLLFYNRKLKRLVASELKEGEFRSEYKGQMELYLRWLARYEREEGESFRWGITLRAGKTPSKSRCSTRKAGVHVAEYLTILPARKVLNRKLHDAVGAARRRFDNKEGERPR